MNWNQILASSRHLVTFLAGAITVLATFNILSTDQASVLKDSLMKLAQAFGEISIAVAPVIAMISGYLASRSASPTNQIKQVAANAEVAKIEMKNPEVVMSIPSEKVVMAKPEGNGAGL
jgi:NADH:ubiquinone oxidoreductase subunit 6 (subunit J)